MAAGKLGANTLRNFFVPIFKPSPPPYPVKPTLYRFNRSLNRPRTRVVPMTQSDVRANGFDIKESTRVRKCGRNRVEAVAAPVDMSFFRVKKLSEKAVLPSRASIHSAGYDLSSAAEVKVPARGKAMVPTDLSIAIPEGTYARVAPRSGLAWKHSIDVAAGVIDADYRGPVKVILFNHSHFDFEVKEGDRVAQLIIEKIMTPEVTEVEDLDETVRGNGGFGSTGV
ncbi:Deoxyuridine 5'-triphosphate nucleotidohydrolase [Morella rubra]|uniref:Deoxyuridine 5'-triphosphate nucleotidohydrolase n=1 Tax=Morella rubra TaxID=262757 RepID=A0A6A1W942_9ROSI|nr:Deoxyuridine 5'-triphosphate nucleotidohydrolase [Morella rubra]